MLYHCQPAQGNFGDDLNPWLWSRLAPEIAQDTTDRLFLGIGTILTDKVPAAGEKVVFGSGYGYGRPPQIDAHWCFYAVRGPLTARKLGIDEQLAITDPAVMLRGHDFGPAEKRFPLAFMPHHQSLEHADWPALCRNSDLQCIDPRDKIEAVVQQIRQTEVLITEAMHGAIVADAFRVPFIPVQIYGNLNRFKWQDWAESVGLEINLAEVPPIYTRPLFSSRGLRESAKKAVALAGFGKEKWNRLAMRPSSADEAERTVAALEALPARCKPLLSAEARLRELEDKLRERLLQLREDWRTGRFRGRGGKTSEFQSTRV